MQERYAKTYAYLSQFKDQLRGRSGFKQYFDPHTAPFYSVYNVGPYTFAPYKVCWMRVSDDLHAAVCIEKRVVPDNSLVAVSVETLDEGHYVCALLNSAIASYLIRSFSVPGNGSWGSPHILTKICVRRWNPADKIHRALAANSQSLHEATAAGESESLNRLEAENLELAAEYWGLGKSEVTDIKGSLEELS